MKKKSLPHLKRSLKDQLTDSRKRENAELGKDTEEKDSK